MKNLLLLLLTTFTLNSCSNNDDNKPSTPKTELEKLPTATQIGANTAGCLIDGKVLIPKNGSQAIGGSPSNGLTTGAGINFHPPIVGDDYKYFRIANLRDKGGDAIYLHLNDMTMGKGEYIVGQSNGNYFMDGPNNVQIIAQIFDGVNLGKTFWSSANSGIITVTRFDYFAGIYSGTFDCTLYNKDNPTETIKITEGRFDIRVATLNQ